MDTLTVCGKDCAKDVFVGIDVFGRGTFGGGGYDCCIVSATCLEGFCIIFKLSLEAMELIKELEMSIAIFAPG